jgi:hypothetical protein
VPSADDYRKDATSGEVVGFGYERHFCYAIGHYREEVAMAEKQKKPEATSAMGPIAHALIQDYLGPDHRVTNMERFFTALMQALHDAYALGWKDRGLVTREPD